MDILVTYVLPGALVRNSYLIRLVLKLKVSLLYFPFGTHRSDAIKDKQVI